MSRPQAGNMSHCFPSARFERHLDSPNIHFPTFAHHKPPIRALTPHEEVVRRLPVRGEFRPSSAWAGVARDGEGADRGICREEVRELCVGRTASEAA